jgi:uncharacterized membrane protein
MEFLLVKWLHVIGAGVLFGTGAGIAFFMLMAHRTGDVRVIAHTAGIVVIADTIFTATAAILQPVTGGLLVYLAGWEWSEGWVVLSIALYVFIGIFWLPVVWIQIQMRNMARAAVQEDSALPAQYYRYFRMWFLAGIPAFIAILALIWLMVAKPEVALF